ncbi:MAG: hypothetical protein A3F72_15810 [Bacteroidetes bacterium RIFCSPLOWO2_12_FULL_35_15]|nr:MAG: hypothetical protein A3F72_15810 [Bacteroidetes bacterium RIFCSPLOWO2_12_FULL_35_15]
MVQIAMPPSFPDWLLQSKMVEKTYHSLGELKHVNCKECAEFFKGRVHTCFDTLANAQYRQSTL